MVVAHRQDYREASTVPRSADLRAGIQVRFHVVFTLFSRCFHVVFSIHMLKNDGVRWHSVLLAGGCSLLGAKRAATARSTG